MRSRNLKILSLAVVALACVGCSVTEPYEREGMWRPRGANAGNLAAMVADPSDLDHGKEAHAYDAVMAATAIDRLHHDKVKPLISSSFEVGGGGGAPAATGASDSDGYN